MIVTIDNQKYFKSDQTGSYYSMQDDELTQHAMNSDGTISKETMGSVDWSFVVVEAGDYEWEGQETTLYRYLKNIERLLTE